MKNVVKTIANEVTEVLSRVKETELLQVQKEIQTARQIFIAGTGRSGLIGKVFAMRLMHSGYPVYVVGETITPSIQPDDVLLIISGSGNTTTLVQYAKKAKEVGAKLALMTTNKQSSIGSISDCVTVIPAATKKRLAHEPETIQPLGSQFDQAAHLLLDALCVELAKKTEDAKKLIYRHANLE